VGEEERLFEEAKKALAAAAHAQLQAQVGACFRRLLRRLWLSPLAPRKLQQRRQHWLPWRVRLC
ncbi:MAG: hypothetical protein ACK56I_19610, partial [bacterium]